jgi:hypothetical protein
LNVLQMASPISSVETSDLVLVMDVTIACYRISCASLISQNARKDDEGTMADVVATRGWVGEGGRRCS